MNLILDTLFFYTLGLGTFNLFGAVEFMVKFDKKVFFFFIQKSKVLVYAEKIVQILVPSPKVHMKYSFQFLCHLFWFNRLKGPVVCACLRIL